LSKHFSVGFSGKWKDDLTYSFDYYRIDIDDRIVLSGRLAEGYEEILEPFGVGAAQFFTNAIDSRTSGIDGAVFYRTELGEGVLNASLAANVTSTKVRGTIKAPPALIGQESVLFNREEVARLESAQPNYKVSTILSYEFNSYQLQLGNTYFGEVKFVHPDDGDPSNWVLNELTGLVETRDQTFSPKLLTDLSISYKFTNYLTATLGGNNVLNVFPDKHEHSGNINNGNFVYSRRVQQFGVSGANYYARVMLRL